MAMKKSERARMAELEAALAAATIGTKRYDDPRPMTRDEIEAAKVEVVPLARSAYRRTRQVALGYGFNDYIGIGATGRVYPMWSDGSTHGRDNHTGDSGSLNMGVMYRTEREAAIALRLSLQKKFGEMLAGIDEMVSQAKGGA